MNTRLITLSVLLVISIILYASEDPGEQSDYVSKTKELKNLAERFKAETGFEGEIGYNYPEMKISSLLGNFKDIDVSAPQDTVYMISIFDQVSTKVMPFISAREGQLIRGNVVSNDFGSRIIYWQKVNGYSVEGGRSLKIRYNQAISKFSIADATAEINDEIIPINITLEQAIELARGRICNGAEAKPHNPRIAYTEGDKANGNSFYLCYILDFWDVTVCVDVSKPLIRRLTQSTTSKSFSISALGEVYNEAYADTLFSPPSSQQMGSVFIQTPLDSIFADQYGNQTVSDSVYVWLNSELNNKDIFYIVEYPDTLSVVPCDTVLVARSNLTPTFYDNDACSSNAYYHAHDQQQFLNSLVADDALTPWRLKITTNYPWTSGGTMHYNFNTIRVSTRAGKLSHVVRHELSHANVKSILQTQFNPTNDNAKMAMDEAFAVYLPCAAIASPYCIYGNQQDPQRIDLLNHINSVSSLTINELAYEDYDVRHTIASAWWDIQSNTNGFNQFLIDALINDVLPSDSLRYKPRYFYNILMRNSLPANQLIIDKAYSDRGLNFVPKVESISQVGDDKNIFGLNEPVYVKVSDCPQNTVVNVYVIKHGEYTIADGDTVASLAAHYASGFAQVITGLTNINGTWTSPTPIWTTPAVADSAVGDYDIIVDIGSPTTPDGRIHYAFIGANVMDGFDGRTEPGFTVMDNGIDVALATGTRYSAHLAYPKP